MKKLEDQLLSELNKPKGITKKKVTFLISEEVKDALKAWCKKNDVTESATIEKLIQMVVPSDFFKSKRGEK